VHGLVEVVDVHHEPAAGVAVEAEIGGVRVTADLRADARDGCVGEVGGHQPGRAAQKGEGARGHPAHPQRYQLRYAAGVGLLDRLHRDGCPVSALLPRPVLGPAVRRPRQPFP